MRTERRGREAADAGQWSEGRGDVGVGAETDGRVVLCWKAGCGANFERTVTVRRRYIPGDRRQKGDERGRGSEEEEK